MDGGWDAAPLFCAGVWAAASVRCMIIALGNQEVSKDMKFPEYIAENNLPPVAIQGEFCGARIKKNRLKLSRSEWYVFTAMDLNTRTRYPLDKMKELCEKLHLRMVPIEEEKQIFPYDSVEALLERARGKYPSGMNKEGNVARDKYIN